MWGAIGSVVGAVASSLVNSRNQKKENSKNRSFAESQLQREYELNQDYAKWSATELPKLNRQGMEAAGFNPLLAINSGTGTQGNVSAQVPTGTAPSLDVGSISSALSGLTSLKQRRDMIDNQQKLQEAQIENLDASNRKLDADAALAAANTQLASAQTAKTQVETKYYGTNNIGTLASRFGEEIVKPAYERVNSAGNWIGDKVKSGAKSFYEAAKGFLSGFSKHLDSSQGVRSSSPNPHQSRFVPKPSQRVRGHW